MEGDSQIIYNLSIRFCWICPYIILTKNYPNGRAHARSCAWSAEPEPGSAAHTLVAVRADTWDVGVVSAGDSFSRGGSVTQGISDIDIA